MQQCERGLDNRSSPTFLTKGCKSARNDAETALIGSAAGLAGNRDEPGPGCYGRFAPLAGHPAIRGSPGFDRGDD